MVGWSLTSLFSTNMAISETTDEKLMTYRDLRGNIAPSMINCDDLSKTVTCFDSIKTYMKLTY